MMSDQDALNTEQRRRLKEYVAELIDQTMGYADALNYTHELAEDLDLPVNSEAVIEELREQLGMPAEEQEGELS